MSASRYVSFHLSVLISSAFRNCQGRGNTNCLARVIKNILFLTSPHLLYNHFVAYFLFSSILILDSYTILFWFCMHKTKGLNKSQIFTNFLYTVQDFRQKSKEANNPSSGMEILLQVSTLSLLIFTLLSLEWGAFFLFKGYYHTRILLRFICA